MRARLGDTIEFNYTAPGIHDKSPIVFFLAKVGKLVHGLNQHYQSPQEKVYYYLMLKNVLYNKIQTGKMSPQTFYRLYVKNRLVTDSYRTYRQDLISSVAIVPNAWASMAAKKVDIKPWRTGIYPIFTKGNRVRFVSMSKGRLSWIKGTIIARKVPRADYIVKTDDGRLVLRHPADLRLDKPY